MKNENVFNTGFTQNSFLNLGKSFIENFYKNAVNAPSNQNHKYKTKGFQFNYIEDASINACVMIKNNYDHMWVNTGTVVDIFAYFSSVFSDSTMFPTIGDVKKEQNIIINGIFDNKTCQILYNSEPQTDERRIIGNFAALLAYRYVLCHELGHLLNGHSYLLNTLYANGKVDMIAKYYMSTFSENQQIKYALDRRTMEMDADSFAATNGIDNIIVMYMNLDKHKFYFDLLDDPIRIFSIWSFAVHSVFLLFEKDSSSNYSPYDYYLPNEAREFLNIASVLRTIDEYRKNNIFDCDELLYSQIIEKIVDGIKDAETYFNKRYSKNFDFIFQTISSTDYNIYSNQVLEHWNNNLFHKLTPYSRSILYSPSNLDQFIKLIKLESN